MDDYNFNRLKILKYKYSHFDDIRNYLYCLKDRKNNTGETFTVPITSVGIKFNFEEHKMKEDIELIKKTLAVLLFDRMFTVYKYKSSLSSYNDIRNLFDKEQYIKDDKFCMDLLKKLNKDIYNQYIREIKA